MVEEILILSKTNLSLHVENNPVFLVFNNWKIIVSAKSDLFLFFNKIEVVYFIHNSEECK